MVDRMADMAAMGVWFSRLIPILMAGCAAPPLVAGPGGDSGSDPSNASDPPGFAVRTAEGNLRTYRHRSTDGGSYSVRDEILAATVKSLGDDQWELTLRHEGQRTFKEVWFPWEPEKTAVNGTLEDDIVYYPRLTGVAEKADTLKEGNWWGKVYPGECFAPLVVVADDTAARIAAAVNWPPKRVRPIYSLGRIGLRYEESVVPGSTQRYRALVAGVRGDPARGIYPWHLVLDKYKSWLIQRMREADLYPIKYPSALRNIHGWLHVDLNHLEAFEVKELYGVYARSGNVFRWIQFWGQMSNYQRSPGDGRRGEPVPPLKPGERTGGCLVIAKLHSRYVPELSAFARDVVNSGGFVGYYCRPQKPYRRLDTPNNPDLAFFTSWIVQNEKDGANAFYLDVLGAKYFGDALPIARMFQTTFPPMAVIEYPTDVYPTSFLISGSLRGNGHWYTRPGQTPQQLDDELTRVTFPRFGRYLLDDRIMFLGHSNDDFTWWGNYRGHQHWTERQAFLLGAKLDAPTRFKWQRGWIEPVNPVVRQIVDEWQRTGWWERQPAYRDRAGIYDVAPGIDVRRFVDKEGINLFVVENWKQQSGRSFVYKRQKMFVPPRRLCILVLPREYDPER